MAQPRYFLQRPEPTDEPPLPNVSPLNLNMGSDLSAYSQHVDTNVPPNFKLAPGMQRRLTTEEKLQMIEDSINQKPAKPANPQNNLLAYLKSQQNVDEAQKQPVAMNISGMSGTRTHQPVPHRSLFKRRPIPESERPSLRGFPLPAEGSNTRLNETDPLGNECVRVAESREIRRKSSKERKDEQEKKVIGTAASIDDSAPAKTRAAIEEFNAKASRAEDDRRKREFEETQGPKYLPFHKRLEAEAAKERALEFRKLNERRPSGPAPLGSFQRSNADLNVPQLALPLRTKSPPSASPNDEVNILGNRQPGDVLNDILNVRGLSNEQIDEWRDSIPQVVKTPALPISISGRPMTQYDMMVAPSSNIDEAMEDGKFEKDLNVSLEATLRSGEQRHKQKGFDIYKALKDEEEPIRRYHERLQKKSLNSEGVQKWTPSLSKAREDKRAREELAGFLQKGPLDWPHPPPALSPSEQARKHERELREEEERGEKEINKSKGLFWGRRGTPPSHGPLSPAVQNRQSIRIAKLTPIPMTQDTPGRAQYPEAMPSTVCEPGVEQQLQTPDTNSEHKDANGSLAGMPRAPLDPQLVGGPAVSNVLNSLTRMPVPPSMKACETVPANFNNFWARLPGLSAFPSNLSLSAGLQSLSGTQPISAADLHGQPHYRDGGCPQFQPPPGYQLKPANQPATASGESQSDPEDSESSSEANAIVSSIDDWKMLAQNDLQAELTRIRAREVFDSEFPKADAAHRIPVIGDWDTLAKNERQTELKRIQPERVEVESEFKDVKLTGDESPEEKAEEKGEEEDWTFV